ncbi:MAG: adenylate/guanylate cyclase domain-containing protein [Mariprofundaceae bacterium]|nr:adenylate/guanylate cyclase domain-containing protein [Mariprofundaceae bacterium]
MPEPLNLALAGLVAITLIGLIISIIKRSADKKHLVHLANTSALIAAGKRREAEVLANNAPAELHQIEQNIRTLVAEVDKGKRNFAELVSRVKQHAAKMDALKEKLKRESVLRAYIARYVGNDVIEQMILSQDADPLKNERCEATLLFADIRSFTTLSENMTPEEVITMLNEYFDAMVGIIFKHGGILDKFVGDELMAVFQPQQDKSAGPLAAVQTGVEMQKRIGAMMQERNARGLPVFQVGIGINTGSVVVGNVGAQNRMDYTVIGDTVNVAARLEQIAEGGEVLVGEQTRTYCKHMILMREKGSIKVKNRDEPVKCYEVDKKASTFQ